MNNIPKDTSESYLLLPRYTLRVIIKYCNNHTNVIVSHQTSAIKTYCSQVPESLGQISMRVKS